MPAANLLKLYKDVAKLDPLADVVLDDQTEPRASITG
jgi:hypothetical protein